MENRTCLEQRRGRYMRAAKAQPSQQRMEQLRRKRDDSKLAKIKANCIGREHKIKVHTPARITMPLQGLVKKERRMGIPNPSVGTRVEIESLLDRGMHRNPASNVLGFRGTNKTLNFTLHGTFIIGSAVWSQLAFLHVFILCTPTTCHVVVLFSSAQAHERSGVIHMWTRSAGRTSASASLISCTSF